MTFATVLKGSVPKNRFVFKDANGNLVDPTSVFFSWKLGLNGTVTTYQFGLDSQLVNESVGIYYVRLSASEVGMLYGRAFSTGTGQAAQEVQIEVISKFP